MDHQVECTLPRRRLPRQLMIRSTRGTWPCVPLSQKKNLVVPACLAARAASSSIPSRRLHRFGGLDVAARNNLHTRGRRLSGVWTDKSTHAHAVPASSSRSTRWRCTPVSALAYKSAPAANSRRDRRRPVTLTRQADDPATETKWPYRRRAIGPARAEPGGAVGPAAPPPT